MNTAMVPHSRPGCSSMFSWMRSLNRGRRIDTIVMRGLMNSRSRRPSSQELESIRMGGPIDSF
jgi:hypothetical protein